MARTLTPPQDPAGLARVIAALRVFSGQRPPKNRTESALVAKMTAQGVSRRVAQRMIANVDAIRKSDREALLGPMGRATYAVPARTWDMPSTITVPLSTMPIRVLPDITGPFLPPVTRTPIYTIRYRGFYCQAETTWDRGSNSDEVYVVTSAVHIDSGGNNVVRTERHPVSQTQTHYGDVDGGEERLGPVAACWQGLSDPVSLTVVVFERDDGDPDAYKEEVDAAVQSAIAVATYFWPPAAALKIFEGLIADVANWLLDFGDDHIDTQTVMKPEALLSWYSRWPLSTHVGKQARVVVGPPPRVEMVNDISRLQYHFWTTHQGSGANYVVGFDVTRRPALPPIPAPPIP